MSNGLHDCPVDVLQKITRLLGSYDILSLYCVDKGVLKPRLTEQGGITNFVVDVQATRYSFPLIACKLRCLTTLSVSMRSRSNNLTPVGTFLYLPATITHLSLDYEHSMTCWLQPKQLMFNNSDDCELDWKPIYIDNLFPQLERLRLTGGSFSEFSPTLYTTALPASVPDNYFTVGFTKLFTKEHLNLIAHNYRLKSRMEWTAAMKLAFISHLPRNLKHLMIPMLPDIPGITSCLPQNLDYLGFSNSTGCLHLSSVTPSLKESLSSLLIYGTGNHCKNIDDEFPPNLTHLDIRGTYGMKDMAALSLLPRQLTYLTTDRFGHQFIDALPRNLTHLELGTCGMSANQISMLPSQLRSFSVYKCGFWTSFVGFPESLTNLKLEGDIQLQEEMFGQLPRGLKSLSVDIGYDMSDTCGPSFVQFLPPDLTSLCCGRWSGLHSSIIFAGLPRSLLDFSSHLTEVLGQHVPDLPPQLTRLQLRYCSKFTDAFLPLLPRTVTDLQLAAIRVTGALLEPMCEVMDHDAATKAMLKIYPANLRQSSPACVYEMLTSLPPHITELCWTADRVNDKILKECVSNLKKVDLPRAFDFSPSLITQMKLLEYFSAPYLTQTFSMETWNNLPPNLTYLDVNSQYTGLAPLPSNLTHVRFHSIHPGSFHNILDLQHLESLKLGNSYGLHEALIHKLPKNLKSLEMDHTPHSLDVLAEALPPKLTNLCVKSCSVTDIYLSRLPSTLTRLVVATTVLSCEKLYKNLPEREEFSSPTDFLTLLHDTSDGGVFPPLLTKNPENFKFDRAKVQLTNEVLGGVPRSVKSFKVTCEHDFLTDELFRFLPRTLTKLDLRLQIRGIKGTEFQHLPPSLKEFYVHAANFEDLGVVKNLPAELTHLELLKAQGRFKSNYAAALPKSLLYLFIDQALLGDEALGELPRTLTDLRATNAFYITDKGVPGLPPTLTKLSMPTCRLSPRAVDYLPITLRSLAWGSGCGMTPTAAITAIQTRIAALRVESSLDTTSSN